MPTQAGQAFDKVTAGPGQARPGREIHVSQRRRPWLRQ
jgi:hypothetical protein